MKLAPLFTFRASLKAPVDMGATPQGHRIFFETTDGFFEGPRIRGKVLSGGGDWILIDDEGVGRLDVRATLQTDDGANIYVQYGGVLLMNAKVAAALANGTELGYGDTYFMTQPRFETGDQRYAWLNRVVAVGEGRNLPGGVEYRVFSCEND